MYLGKTGKGIVKISITALSIETFFTSKLSLNTKWQLLKYNRHIQTLTTLNLSGLCKPFVPGHMMFPSHEVSVIPEA